MKETLYIKIDRAVKVTGPKVTIGDIAKLYCDKPEIMNKCKTLKVAEFCEQGKERYVVSVMKVIQVILQEYPSLDIQNMGEQDFLIEKDTHQKPPVWVEWLKVAIVCVIVFFGAAFAIMTFNEDAAVKELLAQIYEQMTGKSGLKTNIMDIGYSVGLAFGILIFYNHLGRKKIQNDPTPIEVEMRLYEKDIENTLIDGVKREGARIDVG